MRSRLLAAIAVLSVFVAPRFVSAGEPKQAEGQKPMLEINGELKDADPLDKMMKKSFSKIHEFKMTSGKGYKIDLRSQDFDSFLRLEDADGKQLAFDDDSGGFPHARIIHPADKDGVYKIIVTTFAPNAKGAYTLTVAEASKADIIVSQAQRILSLKPEEQKAVIADVRKMIADKGKATTQNDAMLAMNVSSALEQGGDKKLAAELYADFGKSLSTSTDPKVSDFGEMFIGAGRRLRLPGNPMELKGTLVDGKKFDWAPYKGKVVLVDFWATWCGPCIAELPNVKKAYETYHPKGFEVIGVSLDNSIDPLTKFIEKEMMPWANIYEKEHASWNQPLARYYGVMAIPFTVLIGRDGNVVAMNVRGPALDRELEKLVGSDEKEKGKDKEKDKN